MSEKIKSIIQPIFQWRKQDGQILLVVILVMVVALTVGLSVASRSITNLRNSTDEEHSQKAFSAAEAGIEQFLKTSCNQVQCILADSFDNDSGFSAIAIPVSGAEFLMNGGNYVAKDDGRDLWLSDYSEDPSQIYLNPWSGNLTVYWGDVSIDSCSTAALEVIVVSGSTKASASTKRYTFDSCQNRRQVNSFSPGSSGGKNIGGIDFAYSANINNINNGFIARIVPLYYSAKIGVSGGNDVLPSQGNVITSTGTAGDTQRKITLVRGYPELPSEFFQYVLFSTN